MTCARLPAIALATLVALIAPVGERVFADDCAQTGASAYQPTREEGRSAIALAASGRLGSAYPQMPLISSGYPNNRLVSPTVPCIVPEAVAWLESGWRQASGTAMGSVGPILTGRGGCGYGFMQIASGMTYPNQLPRQVQMSIATDYQYNIGYGLKMLAEKWNFTPAIGNKNPEIVEDWYYAVWAYNTWSWRNNPNNSDYAWPRPAYDGSQPVRNYPYQELVFGLAANPPLSNGQLLWAPVLVSLPDPGAIGTNPDAIPDPPSTHTSACGFISTSSIFVPAAASKGTGEHRARIGL